MMLTSSAFQSEGMIPVQHTCDGPDHSPALTWGDVPENAKALALICDDPDAPAGTWVHWVYYNIPAHLGGLPAGIAGTDHPEIGGAQGVNDFRRIGYGGPCPPSGTHRYFFKLYALDRMLDLKSRATKTELLQAMQGHVLREAVLMGRYRR
jgi:Raf kinase inhibitor-like YbhB/YbcL family protein